MSQVEQKKGLNAILERGWNSALAWIIDAPHALRGAAAMRIALGTALFVQMVVNFPFRSYLWGPAAAWSQELGADHPFPFQRALFGPVAEPATLTAAYVVLMLACLALVLGWHTRAVTLVVLLLHTLMTFSDGIYMDQSDNLVRMLLIYLLFMRAGAFWSLDARFERKLTARRLELGVSPPRSISASPFVTIVHNLAVLTVGIHLCLIYVSSAMFKIQGAPWQDGTAVYYPLQIPHFRPFPALSDIAVQGDIAVNIATYGAVYLQLFFPFLLWNKWSRKVALIGIVGMHLGIAVLMGLPFFSAFMLAGDAIFVSSATYAAVAAWLASRFGKHSSERSRSAAASSSLISDEPPVPALAAVAAGAAGAEAGSGADIVEASAVTALGTPVAGSPAGSTATSPVVPDDDVSLVVEDTLPPLVDPDEVGIDPEIEDTLPPLTDPDDEAIDPELEDTLPPPVEEVQGAPIISGRTVNSDEKMAEEVSVADEFSQSDYSPWMPATPAVRSSVPATDDTVVRPSRNALTSKNLMDSAEHSHEYAPTIDETQPFDGFGVDDIAEQSVEGLPAVTPPVSPAVWAEGAYARLVRSKGSGFSAGSGQTPDHTSSSPTAETRISTAELAAITGMPLDSAPAENVGLEHEANSDRANHAATPTSPVSESGSDMNPTPTAFAQETRIRIPDLPPEPRETVETRSVSRKLAYYGSILDQMPPRKTESGTQNETQDQKPTRDMATVQGVSSEPVTEPSTEPIVATGSHARVSAITPDSAPDSLPKPITALSAVSAMSLGAAGSRSRRVQARNASSTQSASGITALRPESISQSPSANTALLTPPKGLNRLSGIDSVPPITVFENVPKDLHHIPPAKQCESKHAAAATQPVHLPATTNQTAPAQRCAGAVRIVEKQ